MQSDKLSFRESAKIKKNRIIFDLEEEGFSFISSQNSKTFYSKYIKYISGTKYSRTWTVEGNEYLSFFFDNESRFFKLYEKIDSPPIPEEYITNFLKNCVNIANHLDILAEAQKLNRIKGISLYSNLYYRPIAPYEFGTTELITINSEKRKIDKQDFDLKSIDFSNQLREFLNKNNLIIPDVIVIPPK